MKGKRGDKSLQMIFGLFILLIISLVVLSLFFRFTEKSSSKMSETGEEFFTNAARDQAIQHCITMCSSIENVNDAIEFCKKIMRVDFNGDGTVVSKYSYGKWDFCEDKIPCFVIADNCKQGTYDGFSCRDILINHRPDAYAGLFDSSLSGICGLTPDSCNNWIYHFGYDLPAGTPTDRTRC